jgi:hypothetical protein
VSLAAPFTQPFQFRAGTSGGDAASLNNFKSQITPSNIQRPSPSLMLSSTTALPNPLVSLDGIVYSFVATYPATLMHGDAVVMTMEGMPQWYDVTKPNEFVCVLIDTINSPSDVVRNPNDVPKLDWVRNQSKGSNTVTLTLTINTSATGNLPNNTPVNQVKCHVTLPAMPSFAPTDVTQLGPHSPTATITFTPYAAKFNPEFVLPGHTSTYQLPCSTLFWNAGPFLQADSECAAGSFALEIVPQQSLSTITVPFLPLPQPLTTPPIPRDSTIKLTFTPKPTTTSSSWELVAELWSQQVDGKAVRLVHYPLPFPHPHPPPVFLGLLFFPSL